MTNLFCPAKSLWKEVMLNDFANDKMGFLGQNVDIVLTSSGHYAVLISRTE